MAEEMFFSNRKAIEGTDTPANTWFKIHGILEGDNLASFVSASHRRVWRLMGAFAEQEGLIGFDKTDRVLECWQFYGASLNRWGSGPDHVLWEQFARMSPLTEKTNDN